VVAGAAVYATTALSGGGRQPDELVPKTTFAYVKVDLDPAANQKLAARSFFGKIPAVKTSGSSDNVFENVLESAFHDGNLDYATDVKPWFDKRAAVAAFPAADGHTEVVGVLRSKDDAKAKASLDKAAMKAKADGGSGLAYTITKGYVVVSETQAAVDDAVRGADQASLRDNQTYRDDVDALHGDQVAVAWADLRQVFDAAKSRVPFSGMLPSGLTDQVKGRVVSGLHLTGDYAEVEGLAFDVPQQAQQKTGDPTLLKGLPASTVAAVSVNGLGDTLNRQLQSLGSGGAFDPKAAADHFLSQAGLSLDNDVLPLFADQTVLALGAPFESLDSLRVGLLTKVADATKAQSVATKLGALGEAAGAPVTASVKGDTLVLATGDYGTELSGGSGLGSSPKFSKAMGDLSASGTAAYVDLEQLLSGAHDPKLASLKALGLVTGTRGGNGFFRLRLVVG
jgi:hypothetical protein